MDWERSVCLAGVARPKESSQWLLSSSPLLVFPHRSFPLSPYSSIPQIPTATIPNPFLPIRRPRRTAPSSSHPPSPSPILPNPSTAAAAAKAEATTMISSPSSESSPWEISSPTFSFIQAFGSLDDVVFWWSMPCRIVCFSLRIIYPVFLAISGLM